MGGGLLDLAAYGAQDVYLTGNPQITFFKTVYRRHTNFSMESVKQTWVGNPNTLNSRAECTLSRTGDLVSGIHFEVQFSNMQPRPSIFKYIKDVSVEIGGQLIDRQTGQFMESYAKLTNKRPPNSIFSRTTLLDREDGDDGSNDRNMLFKADMTYFIPLMFWFCRHSGSALPLVALQYHDIKIILNTSSRVTEKNDIYVDYIYLDTDERRRFAEKSHEYLIEQVQYKTFSTNNTTRFDIGFLNHPVKELIWVVDNTPTSDPGSGGFELGHDRVEGRQPGPPIKTNWKIALNGNDRISERDSGYFCRKQITDHHSGSFTLSRNTIHSATWNDCGPQLYSIAVYSFALRPEELQPSGTCNFSRIDNAELITSRKINYVGNTFTVYAINYNVLRVMSGMGGLAYAN
jgi:hypothetical protein